VEAMRIPAIFLCFLLVVLPVSAQTVSYTAPSDQAVLWVYITSPAETHGDITFYFENGTSVSGSWSYVATADLFDYLFVHKGTATLGGETVSNSYVTQGDTLFTEFSPQVRTNTNNSAQMKAGIGQSWGVTDSSVFVDVPSQAIIRVDFTSDQIVEYDIRAESRTGLKRDLGLTNEGDWVAQTMKTVYQVFNSGLTFIANLLYWLKFFFIDNLMLIIGLYLSVSMAFAARAARGNIGRFFRTFINDQRKLFGFIMEVWRMLLESIGTIRGWFRI
jgi:hypothetical protein